MKTIRTFRKRGEEGSILGYLVIVMIAVIGLVSLTAYVMQTQTTAYRRTDMAQAQIYAEGAAVIAVRDLNDAVTNATGTFTSALATKSYTKNGTLSTGQKVVYERTISSPFSNQTVLAQICFTNAARPTTAKIVAAAKVGG